MKKLFLTLAISLVALSCNMMRSGSPSTLEPAPSPSPVAPKKIFDVPSLLGKKPDEVKNIIGLTPKIDTEFTSKGAKYRTDKYEFSGIGNAYIEFKNEKFNELKFTLDGLMFNTAEELGNFIGVDVTGQTPSVTSEGAIVSYKDFPINGVKVKSMYLAKNPQNTGFHNFAMDMEN